MNIGSYEYPIASILHNDDENPNGRRVYLWVEDDRIVAQAEDDSGPHGPEVPPVANRNEAMRYITEAYRLKDWDLRFY